MTQIHATFSLRHAHELQFADRFLLRLAVLAPQDKQGAAAVAITRVLQAEADEQRGYQLTKREGEMV